MVCAGLEGFRGVLTGLEALLEGFRGVCRDYIGLEGFRGVYRTIEGFTWI